MTNSYTSLYATRRHLLGIIGALPAITGTSSSCDLGNKGIDQEVTSLTDLVEGLVHEVAHYYLALGVLPPVDVPVAAGHIGQVVEDTYRTEDSLVQNELEASAVTCLFLETAVPDVYHRGRIATYAHGAIDSEMTLAAVTERLDALYDDKRMKRVAKNLYRAYAGRRA